MLKQINAPKTGGKQKSPKTEMECFTEKKHNADKQMYRTDEKKYNTRTNIKKIYTNVQI